jgi:amino acid transporter
MDVFSLIVNKMVGTGIYNNPSAVLVLTGNKGLAMSLWVLGFLYTVVSMLIYLEFSAVLPYTGGELVYLDEITSNDSARSASQQPVRLNSRHQIAREPFIRRLLGNGLLFYTIYSFLFVAYFNSGTNSLQVGHQVLVAINPEYDVSHHWLRFIAIVVLSITCLLQYFSTMWGRKLNRWFAVVKLLFLVIALLAGAVLTHRGKYAGHGNGFGDFEPCGRKKSGGEIAKAMLLVIFSYEGWENATFVSAD